MSAKRKEILKLPPTGEVLEDDDVSESEGEGDDDDEDRQAELLEKSVNKSKTSSGAGQHVIPDNKRVKKDEPVLKEIEPSKSSDVINLSHNQFKFVKQILELQERKDDLLINALTKHIEKSDCDKLIKGTEIFRKKNQKLISDIRKLEIENYELKNECKSINKINSRLKKLEDILTRFTKTLSRDETSSTVVTPSEEKVSTVPHVTQNL